MPRRVLPLVLAACALVAALTAGAATAGKSKPASSSSTGSGRVFLPNPVADLQNQSLTDQNDADYAALQPAYHVRPLTNLDGSGSLRGDWATIRSSTGDLAFSPTNTFHFGRSDDRFEQVMAYYWITESQKYIQSLGFGVWRRPINKQSQAARINQWGLDNSFATDKKAGELRFGKGGVDDAEDAEVILHEYGHAIHFSQSPTFYSSLEAGAIGEGFADYWAVTVADVVAPTPDAPCVADWDSVSYTSTVPHCLRRVDRDLD
jgi:zinc metalloprotease ZmpB